MKIQKGITLIALVITIIVMMILVGVSVTVALNGGLFTAAKDAADETEREVKAEQKLADGKIKIGDNWYASYQDYKDGKILEPGIILEESLKIEIPEEYDAENSPVTKELTATLNEIEGNIAWEIDNEEVATIVAEGTKVTITAVAAGTAKITATCEFEGETYTAECEIKVKKPMVLQVGSYVHYEVTYKDVFSTSMPKFTADNGWRYLGKDSEENYLIVSTGIPAKLYYYYNDVNTIGNKADREDGGGNDWWASTAEITALPTTSKYYTTAGYDYNVNSGEPNKYATYGMRYKFESIPFAKSSSATKNAGIYTEINSEIAEVTGSVFRAVGFEDETKVQIRSLTLEDLNRATNAANGNNNRSETTKTSGFKNITGTDNVALGLFDMGKLTGYGESTNYGYWLASPNKSYGSGVGYVNRGYSGVGDTHAADIGMRPVVVLSSDFFNIVEGETEGVYEIEAK